MKVGRGGLKRKCWGELNFKQVAMITHRIDGLLEGNFSPMKSITGWQPKSFVPLSVVFLRFATLYFVISVVVTLFARSVS